MSDIPSRDDLPCDRPGAAGKARRAGRRLTLGDIAASLDLSTATVSLALRDSPLVAEETRRRIKEHAASAGYIYNRSAAALRTARSDMIGVAVHDILNPYFAEIFRALEDELGREKQIVLICNHRDDVERQRTFVDTLLQHRVDGLVLCASVGTTPEEVNRLVGAGIAVTLVCRDVEGVAAPSVRGDDAAGAYAVTRHLLEQGHRQIAMVGGRRQSSAGRDRNAGWRRALQEAGIGPNSQLDIPELMTQADGRAVLPRLLVEEPRPTAVVGFNDLVALGIFQAMKRKGLEPGRDLALSGYDDIDAVIHQTPALTSVWNSPDGIGRTAARLILRQIGGEAVAPERILIPPEVRVRGTTPRLEGAGTGPRVRRV